jgi:hypothetical protein
MNNYLICDAVGRVTGLVTGPTAPTPPDDGAVLRVDRHPGLGAWLVSSGTVIARPPTLADARAAKVRAATARYAALIAAGFTDAGTLYQIDPDSQSRIAALGVMAMGSITDPANSPWPAGFYWIAADNSHVPMDAPTMYAFARAVGGYVSACLLRLRAIKDAIATAADPAALDAIDVTAGYPAAMG